MSNTQIRKVVTMGALSALVLTLGFTNLDFIPLPVAAVTILHLPVIIGALLEGPVVGMFIGLLFGIFSIIKAGMIGVGPIDLAALNFPYIAIIPRLLIGPAAYFVYKTIMKLASNGGSGENAAVIYTPKTVAIESAAIVVAAVVGSFVNTILYLEGIVLVLEEITFPMIIPVIAFNGVLEAVTAALIVLAVISAWKHIPRHGGRSRLGRELEKASVNVDKDKA
jgi:uncharacterized membrane protein